MGMALNHPRIGFDYLPAYQMPGIPWLTSSYAPNGVTGIAFPFVTSFILIKNGGPGSLALAFSPTGFVNGKYVTLSSTESTSMELRVRDMYLSCSVGCNYEILAGLTLINRRESPVLSGSWEGVG